MLFRVMLWSLGLAAVLGVIAVLTASFDVVGRVTATAVLTSVVSAFLWQTSVRLEQSASAKKIAQVGAILFYLCALCGIWEIGDAGRMWGTAFVCLGCLTVAASGRAMQRQADYRYTSLVAAVASVLSGICWLIGIWTDVADSKIIVTGFAIAGWSAAAAVCLVGVGTDPARHWRWIGVVAAVAGWMLSEYAIYQNILPEWVSDWQFVIGSVSATVIHAVLCYASRSAPSRLIVRIVAVVFAIVTALLCDVIVLQDIREDHILLRLTVAAAIVASTSTIATAFIIQRNRRQSWLASALNSAATPRTADAGEFKILRIECPRCKQMSSMSVGESFCPNCDLKIRIAVHIDTPGS